MLWSCNLSSFCSSKIQCPQTKLLSGNRPSSSLSRMSFYLFLLCCAEDLPLLPSVCYGMHGGPETGNTAAGLENLRSWSLVPFLIHAVLFSRFENGIKWKEEWWSQAASNVKETQILNSRYSRTGHCSLVKCSFGAIIGRKNTKRDL